MELKVRSIDLFSEVNFAVSNVEQKVTIPILSHILIKGEKNILEIASTDLDVTFKSKVPCETIVEGGVAVPAKSFAQIVRGFSNDEEFYIKMTPERKLKIMTTSEEKRAEYTINTLPQEDYPRLLEPEQAGFSIPVSTFKSMVKEALVSTGREDTRFSVVGVLFIFEKNCLTMVSTDSHRLSFSKRNLNIDVEEPIRVIVPRKVLLEAVKLESSDTVNIFIKDSHIFFLAGQRILYSRLKDVKFPAFEKVIPKDLPNVLTFKREKMVSAAKRLLYFANLTSKAIYLKINKDGLIHLFTRNESGEIGEEYIQADEYIGEDIEIGLNCEFLIDFLSSIPDEMVVLRLKDVNVQCLLEAKRLDSEGVSLNVIMPLRIEED